MPSMGPRCHHSVFAIHLGFLVKSLLFATGPKLGAHFPLHSTGKRALVFNEEARDCRAVPFDERPEGPRNRLDDRVIAILDDLSADGQGPGDVAADASTNGRGLDLGKGCSRFYRLR